MKKENSIFALIMLLFCSMPNFAYAAVFINEFLPNSVNTDYEWIEIYNSAESPVNISGFNISEEAASKNFTIKDFVLEAKSFVVLARKDEIFNQTYSTSGIKIIEYGNEVASLNLNDGDDSIFLYDSGGQLIDSINDYQNPGEDVSIGRYPDGSSTAVKLLIQTPGRKNDNTQTALAWNYPNSNNSYVNYLVNVIVSITDDTATVEQAMLDINGTNFSMSNNGQKWSYLWNTGLYKPKSYDITISFKDSYGKIGSSTIYNVTVNNTEVINELNSPPILKNVALKSADFLNRANGSLSVSWEYLDEDGDTESGKEILWFVDGAENALLRNATIISASNIRKNQTWSASVKVFDGKNWSSFLNSANLQIANSAPVHLTPAISSDNGKFIRASTLTCKSDSFDIDNDAVTALIKWYRNNQLIFAGENMENKLKPGNFSKNDSIICEATPYDGIVNGSPINSSALKIMNAAPILVSELENKTLHIGKSATISLLSAFMDLDGDEIKFNASNADGIAIKIDNKAKIATLTPDSGFRGARNIVFFASDGISTVSSNEITLTASTAYANDGLSNMEENKSYDEGSKVKLTANANSGDSEALQSDGQAVITGRPIDLEAENDENEKKATVDNIAYIALGIALSTALIIGAYILSKKLIKKKEPPQQNKNQI